MEKAQFGGLQIHRAVGQSECSQAYKTVRYSQKEEVSHEDGPQITKGAAKKELLLRTEINNEIVESHKKQKIVARESREQYWNHASHPEKKKYSKRRNIAGQIQPSGGPN